MLNVLRRLKSADVLGINRRNAQYTLPYNPRRLHPLVDNKAHTKQLALAMGIPVPELYGIIEYEYQIRNLHEQLEPYPDFVVKPARGSGGKGIVMITSRQGELYHKVNGQLLSRADLRHHVSKILAGMYSFGGQPDQALLEYHVLSDPVFQAISYQGVPDIRIVVFLGVPVMAMVRLPTRKSEGKANLHQGATGAGIDIATGTTLDAVWNNQIVNEQPDTGFPVSGIQVPHWDTILRTSARCHEMTGLGYQGADFILDRNKGALLLELNARPGLNIQIANQAGLHNRLKLVEQHQQSLKSIDDSVAFARQHFAANLI
jgi:alpha-L-glutamate ligase-like protein